MNGRNTPVHPEGNSVVKSNSEVVKFGKDFETSQSSIEGVDCEVFIDFEKEKATEVAPQEDSAGELDNGSAKKPEKHVKQSSFKKFWKRRKSSAGSSAKADAVPFTEPAPTPEPRNRIISLISKPHMTLSAEATEYNMNHPRRGKAVIFSHDKFDDRHLSRRNGTKADEMRLEKSLKMLDFEVRIHRNKTYSKILRRIEKLSEEDHTDCDCLFVAVLTHGKVNQVYAKDKAYSPEALWRPFGGDRCPSLAGKPKIFIIQACRGSTSDLGVVVEPCSHIHRDGYQSHTIPCMSDFVIGYSSFQGFISMLNTREGSWYIQSLCEALENNHENLDLHRILTRAAQKVATKFNCEYGKQSPTVLSTLIREVYFTPKNKA